MKIYRLKATFPGHKVFFREYELKADTKLYSFQKFLLNDLSFAPDQMCVFKGVGQDGAIVGEYGLFDMGDGSMDTISFEMLIERGETRLWWVFDLFSGRYLQFDYMGEAEYDPRGSYPVLVASKGSNPNQFSDEYDDFEEVSTALDLEQEELL